MPDKQGVERAVLRMRLRPSARRRRTRQTSKTSTSRPRAAMCHPRSRWKRACATRTARGWAAA